MSEDSRSPLLGPTPQLRAESPGPGQGMLGLLRTSAQPCHPGCLSPTEHVLNLAVRPEPLSQQRMVCGFVA